MHEQLLQAITKRHEPIESFGYGLTTADRYVKQVVKCIGSACPTVGQCPDQLIKDAAGKLAWCSPESQLDQVWNGKAKQGDIKLPKGIEIPDNTLLTLQYVLTTPREDRDGDILRTDGAVVDPKMPLLWQHMPPLILGKMIHLVRQDAKQLKVVSVLLELGETTELGKLCQDAAKLIEADALRFSHGFRVLDYEERKTSNDSLYAGFDIKRFEVMESSLVSVPSNVDAEMELWSRGNLESDIVKRHAKSLFDSRKKQFPGIDLDQKHVVGVETTDETVTITFSLESQGDGMSDGEEDKSAKTETKAVTLNSAGRTNANKLIGEGMVVDSDSWNGPTADAENQYIEDNGWTEYGKWFLGVNEEAEPETKARYSYPFSEDFAHVDRAGLIAIRQRAGQQNETALFEAAGQLIDKIDESEDEGEKQAETQNKAVDLSVTNGMVDEARKGLEWREEHGRGGTQVGVTRANQIINDGKLTEETWRRVKAYFDRHQSDKEAEGWNPGEEGYPSAGRIAWALWGGDPGWTRAQKIVEQLEREADKEVGVAESVNDLTSEQGEKQTKAGRALSRANQRLLEDAAANMDEVCKMEDTPRPCKALCREAAGYVKQVLDSAMSDEESPKAACGCSAKTLSPRDAMKQLVCDGDIETLKAIKRTVDTLLEVEANEDKARNYRKLIGK